MANKKINFKDTQTYKNLQSAFSGEAAARVRYGFFSSVARKAGYIHTSKIFDIVSDQEKEHAEIWFKLLYNDSMPNLNECLKIAIGNEEYEYKNMYAEFAKTAKKEGFNDIANKFLEVGKIEKTHEEKFNKILTSIKSNDVFKNDKEIYWYCTNCGTLVKGKTAPKTCPVCSHPQGYFNKTTLKFDE